MTKRFAKLIALFCILILTSSSFQNYSSQNSNRIIGVKMYEIKEPPKNIIRKWKELRINTAYVSEQVASNTEFRNLTKKEGIATYIIFPVFFNPEILKKNPGLYAITHTAEPAIESWVEFVCPSIEEYQAELIEKAKEMIQNYNPDGISLDFIRHFAFWETVDPAFSFDSIPETCFCDNCLRKFCHDTNINLPPGLNHTKEKAHWIRKNKRDEWSEWKSGQITDFVSNFKSELQKIDPGIKLNLHAVPWRSGDFNNAGLHIVGQNLKELSELVDYISPMCYSFMLYRDPEWINSVVKDFYMQGVQNIVPSIQVKECYRKDEFPDDEFKECIIRSLEQPSKGVIFWSWDYIEAEPAKKAAIKKLL